MCEDCANIEPAPDSPAFCSEFPRPTDDGIPASAIAVSGSLGCQSPIDGILVWPLTRAAMQNRHAIVLRMARDLNDLRREEEGVSSASLCAKGWLPGQVRAHLTEAIDQAAATFSCTKRAADCEAGGDAEVKEIV